jgi:hypothetical protein
MGAPTFWGNPNRNRKGAARENLHTIGHQADRTHVAFGQNRKWPHLNGKSVLPSEADSVRLLPHVRLMRKCKIRIG